MSHGQLKYEITGELFRRGREVGKGGQKTVSECQVQGHVVGIVENPEPDYGDRTFKLLAWPVGIAAQKYHAFPVDRVIDACGRVVGIVMPRRDGRKFTELLSGLTRPDWLDDQLLLEIFSELALAVNAANAAGYLIGDLNPENVVFTNDGDVAILDCDSFFHTALDQVFPTTVGVAEYLAPELQKFHREGRLAEAQRTLGGDSYAFATILFTAVMEGNHPFANQDAIPVAELIEAGTWPHRGAAGPQPRRCCPRLEDIPLELADLFRTTFDHGLMNAKARPSMNEWYCCLKQLSQSAGSAANAPPVPRPVKKQQTHNQSAATTNPASVKPELSMMEFLVGLSSGAAILWFTAPLFSYLPALAMEMLGVNEVKDAPKIWTDLQRVDDVSDSEGVTK